MKSNAMVETGEAVHEDCPTPSESADLGHGLPEPVVRIREEHNISRRDIDPDALKVLYRLARNNYTAYLVGGGVRDLLLSRKPKDFDISTNARPEQIRALFRNCILIGRRFRLAHIRYGDKIIETSTFRRTPEATCDPSDPDADLFQRDDNLFGSPQEDAQRRDFTVNGLFYDIESFSIIDYVGGMEDLAARRIRCIGDPCIRFREDPARMVRAIRFASRLDFTLDPDTLDAIRKHGDELAKASPARLLEEITRLFAFSSGEKAVRLLHHTGLLRVILPEVASCLDNERFDHNLFWRRLRALDTGDTVMPDATPALIFSTLLLAPLQRKLEREWTADEFPRLRFDKIHAFLEPINQRLRFPRKLVDRIVHIYLSQHRFINPNSGGKRGSIANFVTQDSFHEALALAEILVDADGGAHSRLNQWRDMLAERLFGKEETGQHGSGERRKSHGHNGGEPREKEVRSPDGGETETAEETVPGGKKLSRSARRRRNKRLKRHRDQNGTVPSRNGEDADAREEKETPAGTTAPEASSDSVRAVAQPEAESEAAPSAPKRRRGGKARKPAEKEVAPADVEKRNGEESPAAKPAKSRERKGRSRKGAKEAERQPAAAEGEVFQPLTAAAFYAPKSDPKNAEEEDKKDGKKAADKEKKSRAKGKTAGSKKKSSARASESDPDAPLRPDRADEADTPMHWLDEI